MNQRGFSYIEMMVTLAIMGTVACVALASVQNDTRRRQEHELRLALAQIREALDAYKRAADEGRIEVEAGASGYPPSLAALVAGVPARQDPGQGRVYFLRRLPPDPMYAHEQETPGTPPERTWGLRSYASPADAPAPGEDVFDIHSTSPGTGLNGIAYRLW